MIVLWTLTIIPAFGHLQTSWAREAQLNSVIGVCLTECLSYDVESALPL